MSDRRTFLKAVKRHTYDNTAKLVFADWLEERGQVAWAAGWRFCAAYDRWPVDAWRRLDRRYGDPTTRYRWYLSRLPGAEWRSRNAPRYARHGSLRAWIPGEIAAAMTITLGRGRLGLSCGFRTPEAATYWLGRGLLVVHGLGEWDEPFLVRRSS